MSLCFSDSLGKQVFSYFSLPPFRSLCFSLFSLWFYIIFYLCLHIYKCIFRLFLSLPLLTTKREAGFIHWSESDWGHSEKWVSVSRSHALLICACTLKLCCRHSNNNSLASINFFWVRTVITVITVPLWITYCQKMCTHKDTLTHFECCLYPFNLCFCISVFLPPPSEVVNPQDDNPPTPLVCPPP